jgi:hypothetical protein
VVDIYHHIGAVDWWSIWLARPVQYGWWTSTTIFVRWTGEQFGLQGLFDIAGGHLPPYCCSGLVVNLACKACSIWVVDIYHHICAVDWLSICLVQSTALEQDLFDMDGGHLPPYWCSGLVVNLACKACSIWLVDIYHHIGAVDWWSIWLARPVRHGWWTSTTIFGQWTGDHFGLQGLFNMGGGHLPPYL